MSNGKRLNRQQKRERDRAIAVNLHSSPEPINADIQKTSKTECANKPKGDSADALVKNVVTSKNSFFITAIKLILILVFSVSTNILHGLWSLWSFFLLILSAFCVLYLKTESDYPEYKNKVRIGSYTVSVIIFIGFLVFSYVTVFHKVSAFTLHSRMTFANLLPEKPHTWMVYMRDGGLVASPVPLIMFIQFTNIRETKCMIDSYWVDQDTGNNNYVQFPLIDAGRGTIFFGAQDFQHVRPLYFPKDSFQDIIENKNIEPNETVQGWIFVEMTSGNFQDLRFHVREADGKEYIEKVVFDQSSEEDQNGINAQRLNFVFGESSQERDIGNLPRVLYSTGQPLN